MSKGIIIFGLIPRRPASVDMLSSDSWPKEGTVETSQSDGLGLYLIFFLYFSKCCPINLVVTASFTSRNASHEASSNASCIALPTWKTVEQKAAGHGMLCVTNDKRVTEDTK